MTTATDIDYSIYVFDPNLRVLKWARRAAGLSRRQVAEKLGTMGYETLLDLEFGVLPLRIEDARQLFDVYGFLWTLVYLPRVPKRLYWQAILAWLRLR